MLIAILAPKQAPVYILHAVAFPYCDSLTTVFGVYPQDCCFDCLQRTVTEKSMTYTYIPVPLADAL